MSNDENQSEQLRIWLAAVAVRDAAAFRSLYEATAHKLFSFALRILARRELAEDVLQESFVKIWHSAATYRPGLAAPMTWMSTIVRNRAFDALRRLDEPVEIDTDAFDVALADALDRGERTPPDAMQSHQQAQALAHCLARLECLHRQAIALAFYHDLSHREVADRMALPIGTVKAWIRRGLEQLQICLARQERA